MPNEQQMISNPDPNLAVNSLVPTGFEPIFDPHVYLCCELEHWRIHAKDPIGHDFYLVKCDPHTGDYDPERDRGEVFSPDEFDHDFSLVGIADIAYFRDEYGETFPEGFLPEDGRPLWPLGGNDDGDDDPICY